MNLQEKHNVSDGWAKKKPSDLLVGLKKDLVKHWGILGQYVTLVERGNST